jgi:hypothetical protein
MAVNVDNGNFRLKVASNEMEVYFTDIRNWTNVQGHMSIDILFVVYR